MTTIVDKSGVHTHMVKYCTCPAATAADIQLFKMGLFPVSFLEPKTAFTFDVLNDFLLDNLECRTSAMNYYSKLRRMTTTIFLHLVPDQYQELMRVARQWRKLKLLKRNGFGHEEKEVKPGDLALFCLACPQPGINTPSWLYTRSLVMDGNFKAEHLHAVNPGDKATLMDGRGFMVRDALYKEHLTANASHHRLEATGIGGCACARHGCFVPHAMVDFQKGERQMNMDYALCEALKINTDGLRHVLTFYDVNCQYHKRLKDHIAESLILEIPKELNIIPGIGLWHVHGHQDSCFVRYASNFIEGTGRIDGEIMETLWVPLNIISLAACGMGTPHHKECLDYQMNDCNFMKIIRMSAFSCLYIGTTHNRPCRQVAVQELDETADPVKVREWEAQERAAHQWRHRDPMAMDIYEVQLQKASLVSSNDSEATWLAEELTIEKAQVTLQMTIRRLGARPTDTQQLDIDRWRQAGLSFLSDDIGDTPGNGQECPKSYHPEKTVIPLPSNLGLNTCTAIGVNDLVKQELILRQGRANDALQNIRVHLADKAVIFRKTVRASIYLKCWKQLCNLSTDDSLLQRYQALVKEQLKVSTAVADPNLWGQRNNTLPWFWSLDVAGDSKSNDWLNEFYCVHWLRAKALKDCWAEEMLLVQHEMEWTCNFFLHKAEEWKRLGVIAKEAKQQGSMAYAGRQGKIYECLLEEARQAFHWMKA
ncbi:hypothetical protein EV424DRAFT_1474414 [Suillus variegatus]|nr:hypothetical protein EV424DRAFT_1474414 [Suillus variegatus]